MAPNKEDTVIPPGDCKASGSMIDAAAPFVKQVLEPVATIFVVAEGHPENAFHKPQTSSFPGVPYETNQPWRQQFDGFAEILNKSHPLESRRQY